LYQSYALGFEFNMLIVVLGMLALAFAKVPQPKNRSAIVVTA